MPLPAVIAPIAGIVAKLFAAGRAIATTTAITKGGELLKNKGVRKFATEVTTTALLQQAVQSGQQAVQSGKQLGEQTTQFIQNPQRVIKKYSTTTIIIVGIILVIGIAFLGITFFKVFESFEDTQVDKGIYQYTFETKKLKESYNKETFENLNDTTRKELNDKHTNYIFGKN